MLPAFFLKLSIFQFCKLFCHIHETVIASGFVSNIKKFLKIQSYQNYGINCTLGMLSFDPSKISFLGEREWKPTLLKHLFKKLICKATCYHKLNSQIYFTLFLFSSIQLVCHWTFTTGLCYFSLYNLYTKFKYLKGIVLLIAFVIFWSVLEFSWLVSPVYSAEWNLESLCQVTSHKIVLKNFTWYYI